MWLGRELGAVEYGIYGVIMGLVVWIEVGAVSGLPTAVQRFVSAHEDMASAIVRSVAGLQLITIFVFFLPTFLLSPVIGHVFGNVRLGYYLQIAICDIWLYGFFFVTMFLQNGLHRFGRQAVLIAVYSLTRMILVMVLVSLFDSVKGAFIANIAGSGVGLALGLYFLFRSNLSGKDSAFDWRILVRFAFPVAIFSLAINLFTNIDLWMVNYFIGGAATGHYTAASTIARVPYYLFFGLSATVMPSVSQSISRHDETEASQTIRSGFRLIIMVLIPLVLFIVSKSTEVITLIYGENYTAGGRVLALLIVALSFLAVFFLLTTIINADNRPKISLMITVGGVVLDIFLNAWLTPRIGATGAALSTTFSIIVVCLVAGVVVYRRFGPLISWRSLAGMIIAAIPVLIMVLFIPTRRLGVLFLGVGAFLVYGVVLFLMGENPFKTGELQ